jgi:hypothetical protein
MSMPSPRRLPLIVIVPAAATALLLVGGCSAATYDQKLDYLHTSAERGAQMHFTLQYEKENPTLQRCTTEYNALTGTDNQVVNADGSPMTNGAYAPNDAPNDVAQFLEGEGVSPNYASQISDFYVTSCVTGVPKPVPGQSTAPSTPSAPATSTGTTTSSDSVGAH